MNIPTSCSSFALGLVGKEVEEGREVLKRADTHTTAGLSSPVIPPVVVPPHPESKAALEEAAFATADFKGAKTRAFFLGGGGVLISTRQTS